MLKQGAVATAAESSDTPPRARPARVRQPWDGSQREGTWVSGGCKHALLIVAPRPLASTHLRLRRSHPAT